MKTAGKPNGPPVHLKLEQERIVPGATPLTKFGDCQSLASAPQPEPEPLSPSSADTTATFHSAQEALSSSSDFASVYNYPDSIPQTEDPDPIRSYLHQISYAADDDPFGERRRPVTTTSLSDARQQLVEACIDHVFNSLPTHLLRITDMTIVTRNEIWDAERSQIENILDENLGELRYEYSKGLGWHWTGFLERSWCEVSCTTAFFANASIQTWTNRNMPRISLNSRFFRIVGVIVSPYFTK